MASGRRLRDVIIVLPGIIGSTLSRRGKDIWAPTHRLAVSSLVRPSRAADALMLGEDDEVTAASLMPDARMVGGLVKLDGYTSLTDAIAANFDVRRANAGDPGELPPANLIEFPYDWRMDNRVTAKRLADVARSALVAWREYANVPDARLVIVAHSMGGLVARYFLEVLGGWPDCRALITIGTPFRGSLDALGYLANGYKRLNLDLTKAMRTFPAVYQLLPIYPVVHNGQERHRIAETEGIAGIDPALAADALAFHREIEAAVEANDNEAGPARYALLPVVGTHQPTFQSAVRTGTSITLSRQLPAGVDQYFGDEQIEGDGTVAICSAAAIDQSNVYSDVYQAEKHGSLQRNRYVLGTLVGRLAKMQASQLAKLRGPEPAIDVAQLGISLDLADVFTPDEQITATAAVVADGNVDKVLAEIEDVTTHETRVVPFARDGASWSAELADVRPGTYRITVSAKGNGRLPDAVHDLFQVAE